MSDRLDAALDQVAKLFTDAAPPEWIRLVAYYEYETDADGDPAKSAIKLAIRHTPDGLTQDYPRTPPAMGWAVDELHEAAEGTDHAGWSTMVLEIDRDGSRRISYGHGQAKNLHGVRDDESWDRWHEYLDRNRPELEELAARL